MDFVDVPEISNVVTVGGSPCMSPVDHDVIYQELQCTEQTGLKGYGSCYGNSPDQGYESDSLNATPPNYSDYTPEPSVYDVTPFTDMYTPSTYHCTYVPMTNSNENTTMPVTTMTDCPAPLKMEPIDDFVCWPSASQSYTDALEYIDLTLPGIDTYMPPMSQTSTTVCDVTTNHSVYVSAASQQSFKSEPHAWNCDPNTQMMPYYTPPSDTLTDTSYDSCLEISDTEQEIEIPGNSKAPRKRRRSTKQPILWRFLLDALNQPDKYAKMIHWVDITQGTFQFTSHHKEELSRKWGVAKRNRCTMTYQKMARALRNYINRGEVLRKVKRKLQYTFLPEFYTSIAQEVRWQTQ